MCPACNGLEWTVEELSGRGTLHSWVVSHHPTEPDATPRIVALVQLEEGPRIVSNLQGIVHEHVKNDMPIHVTFEHVDGVKLPQFRPTSAPASA